MLNLLDEMVSQSILIMGVNLIVTVPEEESADGVNIGSSYGTKPVRRGGELDKFMMREVR